MPQRIGPAETCRVSVTGSRGGVNIVNVFWCTLGLGGGTYAQADLDTWTAAFLTAFKTNLLPQYNNEYSLTLAKAVLFADGTATNVLESQVSNSGVGGVAGTTIGDLAAVISWLSHAYWRGGKPRTYVLGSPTNRSGTAINQWVSTYITALNTAAQNFQVAVNALTGGTTIISTQLGFVSFRHGGADRIPPVFFPITGHVVHPRIASQRRRLGKWVA